MYFEKSDHATFFGKAIYNYVSTMILQKVEIEYNNYAGSINNC